MNSKPGNVQLIGIFMIVSGALNIIAAAAWIPGLIAFAAATLGIGLLCLPVLVIPLGLGIFEIITGVNIVNHKPARNIPLIAGLEIASILWGNVLSMAAGILNLVFFNDPETNAYFKELQQ